MFVVPVLGSLDRRLGGVAEVRLDEAHRGAAQRRVVPRGFATAQCNAGQQFKAGASSRVWASTVLLIPLGGDPHWHVHG